MLLLNQIKLMLEEDESLLPDKITSYLKIKPENLLSFRVVKKSLDARRKDKISFIYRIEVSLLHEETVLKRFSKDPNVCRASKVHLSFASTGMQKLSHPPVIVGSGPCGLFCAYVLAKAGYRPLIVERGKTVEKRLLDIRAFWEKGVLNENSNVQFGEGGAGTFSDGKLNTLIRDKKGYSGFVLNTFVKHGAPEEILYVNKPHIGSDKLHEIIPSMRHAIEEMGGEFLFETCLTDIGQANASLSHICLNGDKKLSCDVLVLALGHSARDTFSMLKNRGIPMQQKPFAMGVRVEHFQQDINKMQYGSYENHPKLSAADYKLTYTAKSGRGVYSFCMCPGGVVVNAASEKNTVVTNGMSYFARDKQNANSALVVTVRPEDFGSEDVLAGIEFQRKWEKKAYELTHDYCAPAQTVGSFLENSVENKPTYIKPSFPNGVKFCRVSDCLPGFVSCDLKEALCYWGKHFAAFADPNAILTGVETRTSSPVRLVRNGDGVSEIDGIYPAGEGAGYAGGIMSAAIDGIKTAEHIMARYALPCEEERV